MKTSEKIIAVLCCLICLSACGNSPTFNVSEEISTVESSAIEKTVTVSAEITTTASTKNIENTESDIAYEVYRYETFDGRPEWGSLEVKSDEIEVPENASYAVKCTESLEEASAGRVTLKYYDDHDNLIVKYYSGQLEYDTMQCWDIYSYEYNDDGTIAVIYDEVVIPEYERTTEAVYEYDDKGRLITVTKYNNDGIKYSLKEYAYGKNDFPDPIKWTDYCYKNGNKECLRSHEYDYEYDDNDRMLWKRTFHIGEQSDVLLTEYYTYDDSGNVINVRKENGNGTKDFVNYEYDSQNRIIKQETYYNDKKYSTEKYEYEFYN